MNFKSIIFYLGVLSFPVCILSFLSILYSSYFDYFLNVNSYFITLAVSFIIGIFFYNYGKKSTKKLDFYDQLLLIILSYLLTSLFVSIPYYLSNYQILFIDSIFESISGLTLTGFTIFENIKYLDPTLILWRSSSQWLGGFYFLVFLIILFSNKQFDYKLNYLAYSGEFSFSNEKNIKDLIIKIFIIYLFLSALIFSLLAFSNVRLFDALNLGMTLVSTGGFIPTNTLDLIIKTNAQKIIIIISLAISLLNIFFLFNLPSNRRFTLIHREDIYIIFLFIIFSLILSISVKELSLSDCFIGVLSSLSNSGLSINTVPNNISLYFLFLTIVGGSLISNSSGIKLMRIYILLKSSASEIMKLVRPNNVFNQNIFLSDKKITLDNIKSSFLIFVSFLLSIFILSSFLIIDDINFETSFKLSILTLTNTVNSDLFGVQNINFSNMLTTSKISIIIFMIVGKIELISIILIFKKYFYKN